MTSATPMSDTASVARLTKAERVVVKIGSALLTDSDTGKLNRPWLQAFVEDIATMRARGQDVLIVSSGAIALGRRALKLAPGKLKLEESQAAAAIGQISLAHAFQEILSAYGHNCAQILLTLDDTEERRRYLNARSTLNTLLKFGAVPVINENDTVATSEIRYGDNDRLAARVASMISADCLVLLSDIDGLYTAPPSEPGATHLPEVTEITPAIEAMAGDAASEMSRGGMKTKVAAAKIAVEGGCNMAIGNGRPLHPLRALEDGARCTWFLAAATPVAARKRWISGGLKTLGTLTIDAGAARALAQGRSLLPAGVKAVDGTFDRGDAVSVRDEEGREIARGLITYSSDDAARLKGRNSSEIESLLGFSGRAEMIHRDDLVLKS
ncbi:MAG: glutamate 5-kinase [Parvibaculum sp.]|nr:glutamate 5-kinase [Parvibaculum sp.]|tara:strand:+ start:1625 stop:2773 length:1149 start_codon:yes stop_codon:yes gene_type:complete